MDTALLAGQEEVSQDHELNLPEGVTAVPGRTYRDMAKHLGMAVRHFDSLSEEVKSHPAKSYRGDRELTHLGWMEKQVLLIRRLAILEDSFRVLHLDKEAVRTREGYGRSNDVKIPLVFYATLPLKPVTEIRKGEYRCNARTPHPPVEAENALLSHQDKFDSVQLWWVPKEVVVVEDKKDPILVGVVSVPVGSDIYFEIYRWVDPTIESPYWAKEGY